MGRGFFVLERRGRPSAVTFIVDVFRCSVVRCVVVVRGVPVIQ